MKAVEAMASMMAMDDAAWKRHANPWSVRTRFPLLVAIVAIIFWRDALGWWVLPLLLLSAVWAVLNPRAFPEPASTDNWASKAVMGERVWLNRKVIPIPPHHQLWATGLTIVSAAGMLPLAWGLVLQEFWLTAFGTLWVMAGKLWFVDRMVWLYEDMARTTAEYASWLK